MSLEVKQNKTSLFADDTSTARLTLWQEKCGHPHNKRVLSSIWYGSTYSFKHKKYLSMAHIGTEIKEIEGIGDIITQPHDGSLPNVLK